MRPFVEHPHLLTFIALTLLLFAFPAKVRAQEQTQAADTTSEEEIADDEDETPDLPWSASAYTLYDRRSVRNGLDVSGGDPSIAFGVSISHSSGLTAGMSMLNVRDSAGGIPQRSFSLGYDGSFSDVVGYTASYTYTHYRNDSLNAVANMPHTLALGLTFDLQAVSIAVQLDHLFGSSVANFVSVNTASVVTSGKLSWTPNLDIVFGSQTVDHKRKAYVRLPKKSKLGPRVVSTKPVTVRGITDVTLDLGLAYDIGGGFKVAFDPAFVYTPVPEIAVEKTQFVWTAGIRYEVSF